jgi:hypothetical protein
MREFMMYAAEMGSGGIIYEPSFMKIGTDFRAILRFRLQKLEKL